MGQRVERIRASRTYRRPQIPYRTTVIKDPQTRVDDKDPKSKRSLRRLLKISFSKTRYIVSTLGLFVLVALIFPLVSKASQRRNHFTEQEVEQIKDTQILDKRIDVLSKLSSAGCGY